MTDPTPTRAEVERYSPVDIHERNADMLAEPDGQWVRLSDYQAARRAEAAAWNDAIEAAAVKLESGLHVPYPMLAEAIRALRRAAPTEGEA